MDGRRWRWRIITASFILAAVTACESPSEVGPNPEPATAIRFVRDGTTCSGGGQFQVSVDGAIRDTVTLFPGDQSPPYDVTPGQHEVVGRRLFVTSGLTQWGPSIVTVADGETRAFVMTC